MESRINYALLGIFVLISGAGLVAVLLWFAVGGPNRPNYSQYLVFTKESVWALSKRATVRYNGVRVGYVSQIGLDPDNPSKVRLLLDIIKGTPIKTDTRASLQLQGITGSAFVSLSGGNKSSPPLKKKQGEPYPVIKTSPSLLQRLDVIVNHVSKSMTQSTKRLSQLLSDRNISHISQTLTNLDNLSGNLAQHSKKLDNTIDQLNGLIRQTRKSTADLPVLMHHLDQLTTKMDGSAQAIQRTLPKADQALEQFSTTMRSVRRLSNQLEKHPSSLLFGPPHRTPGPGE